MDCFFLFGTKITSGLCFSETDPERDLGIITETENPWTGHKSFSEFQCTQMIQSQLTSSLFRFAVVLLQIVLQIGSIFLHIGLWKQWEATSLCGSQPPMRSPSLFSHCHIGISTHSFNINRPSPVRKHFITLLLLTFLQFVSNEKDCTERGMYQCWLSSINRDSK